MGDRMLFLQHRRREPNREDCELSSGGGDDDDDDE